LPIFVSLRLAGLDELPSFKNRYSAARRAGMLFVARFGFRFDHWRSRISPKVPALSGPPVAAQAFRSHIRGSRRKNFSNSGSLRPWISREYADRSRKQLHCRFT
jgi:hypothetical protein